MEYTIFRPYHTERKVLQIVLCLLLAVPLGLGPIGILKGLRGLYWVFGLPQPATIEPDLDSDFRFLAAVFMGMGIILAWMIPQIERQTVLFRIISFTLFVGGTARLISVYIVGNPNVLTWILMVVELLFPILYLWQSRIARLATKLK